jgi:hypothetical protein
MLTKEQIERWKDLISKAVLIESNHPASQVLVFRSFYSLLMKTASSLFSEVERLRKLVDLFSDGWVVERASLYDEEGVEGWIWTSPRGVTHCVIGSWDDGPELPGN